jgi:hypothetical protein
MGETKRLDIVAGLKQDVDIEVNLSAAYECDGGPPKSTGYRCGPMPEVHVPNLGDEEHEDQLDPAPRRGRHRGRIDGIRS